MLMRKQNILCEHYRGYGGSHQVQLFMTISQQWTEGNPILQYGIEFWSAETEFK